jgi:hypothetical protein
MGGYFVQKGHYQQQDTNNNKTPVIAGMQAAVETPTTVPARQWCWQQH